MQWLRRSFIAGFFVTVPLVISVAAFIWIFRLIDGFVGPFYAAWLGRNVPGLGILTTALLVLLVGEGMSREDRLLFAVGMAASAVVGYVTIKYFMRFLAGHRLDLFAYYRLALAAVTVVWLMR